MSDSQASKQREFIAAMLRRIEHLEQALNRLTLRVDELRYRLESEPPRYWALERERLRGER